MEKETSIEEKLSNELERICLNICFITDENYVLPTLVAVKSLVCNTKNPVNVYIVSSELSKESQELFRDLETNDCKIFMKIAENPGVNIETEHQHVSKAAMLKFALPNVFEDLDTVLYIDGDVLILDDLLELYSKNLGDNYVGAIADMSGMITEEHHIKYGFKKYFNSGVMLLNLKKMREDGLTSKLVKNKINDEFKHFMDQDTFNKTFNENVLWLSPKFNHMAPNLLQYSNEEIAKFYEMTNKEYEEIKKAPVISHLTNKVKPWNTIEALDFNEWYYYFKMLKKTELTRKTEDLFFKLRIQKLINYVKNFLQNLFSVKNDGLHIVLRVLGIKIKLRRRCDC